MKPKKESVARWISILYRYGQSYNGNRLKPIGLGKGRYLFLIKLYENDGIRQDDLATMLQFDKATVARAISRLERDGFVTRKTDSEDRRAKRVYLTRRAVDAKPRLFAVLHEWTDVLVAGFSETERKVAVDLLKRMVGNASDAVGASGACRTGAAGATGPKPVPVQKTHAKRARESKKAQRGRKK